MPAVNTRASLFDHLPVRTYIDGKPTLRSAGIGRITARKMLRL